MGLRLEAYVFINPQKRLWTKNGNKMPGEQSSVPGGQSSVLGGHFSVPGTSPSPDNSMGLTLSLLALMLRKVEKQKGTEEMNFRGPVLCL